MMPSRERLMPWRTVIEVAKNLSDKGHDVVIVNGCDAPVKYDRCAVSVCSVAKGMNPLRDLLLRLNADVLFMEAKWRDAVWGFGPLKELRCSKFAYFTGGVYDLRSAWLLARLCGLWLARAYFAEVIMPKRLLAWRLRQASFDGAIGLTPKTAAVAAKVGCDNVKVVLPGKDEFEQLVSDVSVLNRYGLSGKRFFCFAGAPAPTRGAQLLLRAIDKAKSEDLHVVFLMRTDFGSDFSRFNAELARMRHRERVVVVVERMTRCQLKAFFEAAWYVVLPFVVIPSEIPLTFLEIMSCHTPVITFDNGGTTDYLASGLLVAQKSVDGLSRVLDEAWINAGKKRSTKAEQAQRLMHSHPVWADVAKMWSDLLFIAKP